MTLIDRIEAATGPDRGLDAEIELATGNWTREHYDAWWHYQECGEAVNPPMAVPVTPQWFTTSLDAAMTLVPEGWAANSVRWIGGRGLARVWNDDESMESRAPTPALALCAAALRAIAAQKEPSL